MKSILGFFKGGDGDEERKPSEKETDWTEKRGHGRVEFDELHLWLNLQVPVSETKAEIVPARIRNVSVRGCKVELVSGEQRDALKVGEKLLAALKLDEFSIPLTVEVVRHVGRLEAALRFRAPFPRELEALERYLQPRYLGRSMREIDPSALQREAASMQNMRWFQGVNDTNLFCWYGPDGVKTVHEQLIFLDRVIEWDGTNGVRTGHVRPESNAAHGWVGADLLEFDSSPDRESLNLARTLIECSRIDGSVKKEFLDTVK